MLFFITSFCFVLLQFCKSGPASRTGLASFLESGVALISWDFYRRFTKTQRVAFSSISY